ncbi:hypothetical protein ABIE89_000916 [Bradyrhizobium niftali]
MGAIDRGAEDQIEFVDETGAQERAIGDAAALDQQALDAELAVENVERQREIDLRPAGKDVGHALAAQTCKVCIRHALGQHHHDRIAANIRAAPADLALRIEHDAIGLCITPRKPRLPRKRLGRPGGIGLALGELRAGDAADHPGIAAELIMDLLEPVRARALRTPAAGVCAAIQAGVHQTDDIRLHANLRTALRPPFRCRRSWRDR